MAQKQNGFTLIEIAIVLVIIGLLLGGVLKGQELIQSARVRNLISQQDGIKAAYFGFLDRFRAVPGDYNQASPNIAGVAGTSNGNNNGRNATQYQYTYTSSEGSTTLTTSTSTNQLSSFAITGLTNWVSYRITVRAINAAGSSLPSGQSNEVVPFLLPTSATIGEIIQ